MSYIKGLPDDFYFKLLFGFPDVKFNEEAGTATIKMFDLVRLLDRLDYLEHPPTWDMATGEMVKREEPPKFIEHYREGGWIDHLWQLHG